MRYTIHFSEVWPYLDVLAIGLLVSVAITGVSIIIGTLLGLFTALGRSSSSRSLRRACSIYVEALRNTPLLVQMFLVYYGLGQFGVHIPPLIAATLAMTLNQGAYTSVIFEAGINAVDVGEKEAALALGMTPSQVIRHIVVPKAFRIVFPPLTNQAISLFLFSSVASTIAVPELTYQTLYVESVTFRAFEVFTVTAGFYLVCTLLTMWLSQRYERRHRIS